MPAPGRAYARPGAPGRAGWGNREPWKDPPFPSKRGLSRTGTVREGIHGDHALPVSRIADDPESEPRDKLQKTRVDNHQNSGKTRKSESTSWANATRNAGEYQEKNIASRPRAGGDLQMIICVKILYILPRCSVVAAFAAARSPAFIARIILRCSSTDSSARPGIFFTAARVNARICSRIFHPLLPEFCVLRLIFRRGNPVLPP
jgi:hypothetical protein